MQAAVRMMSNLMQTRVMIPWWRLVAWLWICCLALPVAARAQAAAGADQDKPGATPASATASPNVINEFAPDLTRR